LYFQHKGKKVNKIYPVLRNCQLFAGIRETDIESLLNCLSARQKSYSKNSFIYVAGDKISSMGIVLSGAVHILREDFWGKRKIVARIESGALFGEAFACAGVEKIPTSVMAVEDSEILFVDSSRIIRNCSSTCVFHNELIKNLTLLLANKNIAMLQKLEHITQTTTREKLLSYLSQEAQYAGKNTFTIPFNREELADYLSVERSAMSAELSRMQEDGLLHYQKNHFELRKGILE